MSRMRILACAVLAGCGGVSEPRSSLSGISVREAPGGKPSVRRRDNVQPSDLQYSKKLCSPEVGNGRLLARVTFEGPPVEYVELRRENWRVDSAGWRCRGVLDSIACEDEYRGLQAPTDGGKSSSWLVAEHGPHFTAVVAGPQLQALLGPIDTLAEAALVALMAGYEIQCDESTGEAEGDGWLLRMTSLQQASSLDGAPPAYRQDLHVLEVSRLGSLRVRRTIVGAWRP